MEERHLKSALEILNNAHYINLATVCEDGSPWNTPVSATRNGVNFEWGSSPENVHSKNIERDGRIFITIYDTHAPEGKGEGLYLLGKGSVFEQKGMISIYRFTPDSVWINDEAKNHDGTYKHDIRVALDLKRLKQAVT